MLTFFNRSHTESVTVDYYDFPEDAFAGIRGPSDIKRFQVLLLSPYVAHWMQVKKSSAERDSQSDSRHARKTGCSVRNQLRC